MAALSLLPLQPPCQALLPRSTPVAVMAAAARPRRRSCMRKTTGGVGRNSQVMGSCSQG